MATREKKLSNGRKQDTSSPLPPKEDPSPPQEITPTEDPVEDIPDLVRNPASKASLAKKLTKPRKQRATLAIKLKPKLTKKVVKPKIIKTLMNSPKNADAKKKLLKTCAKQVKPRKPRVPKNKTLTVDIPPPVLEPILPINEDAGNKPSKKKAVKAPRIDFIKTPPMDQTKKKVNKRKMKSDAPESNPPESIDDVMNDLTSLISTGDIKEEPDLAKPKRVIRRKKKENIENTLAKLSPSQRKMIDMLDLNVRKFKGLPVATKRRHSIEKFPVGALDSDVSNITPFSTLPRCLSPRSKNLPRNRQSLDALPRRTHYKTRSDSPARILRNGKHRKLKDMELLEGLDIRKRRRRHLSDFSGSEISFSKSGYESDSSFSDLSSLHGEIKTECKENFEECQLKSEAEAATASFDTNSNICLETKEDIKDEVFQDPPNDKFPEKSLILDIMKQTFNDIFGGTKEQDEVSTAEEPNLEIVITPEVQPEEVEVKAQVLEELLPLPQEPEVLLDHPEEENADSLLLDEPPTDESPENLVNKENILQALGLQSLQAAAEAKLREKERADHRTDCYTGTLKTVIKLNRNDKKKGRMKMSLHKAKTCDLNGQEDAKDGPSTSWKHGAQSSDTADGSSEHTSDGETAQEAKSLVIPEKASSFSIHPGRLCKDECSYCFGKFGLFDTPCHIAQIKSLERQDKILSIEKHLTHDSCLCDACYRHVDRKANTPSYSNKSYKRNAIVLAPGPRQDHCHVLGCGRIASNILRRKWIIKMRKSICDVINIDLDNPGLHSIPICDDHYSALEHLMVCAMCKRRLAKNHVHYLGPENVDLNMALTAEGIPMSLSDKPVVCKLCKYFAAIILKPNEDRPENSATFFKDYKKRLLHFNDIVPMDEAAAEEPIIIPSKEKNDQVRKKRKLSKNPETAGSELEEKSDQSRVPSTDSINQSRPESPSDYMVDYNTLIPSIAMECGSDSEARKEPTAPKKTKLHSVKQAVEISKTMKLKLDKSSDIAVQRLGSNPSISVRQLFPCEEDLPLQGHVDFVNVKERTPEGWEKCSSVIQYDMETKHLWQELQKPYGNQSSFLRHLILLEKYFRNGDLVLANNASHHSVNYSESVHNRLRAYDNIPSSAGNVQPISMIPFNKAQKSTSGIITSTNPAASPPKEIVAQSVVSVPPTINAANIPKNTPITLSQLSSPPLIPAPPPLPAPPKTKPLVPPPGLISLHPGTNRPVGPLVKAPLSQKIKFPITKNWRPTLIPIDAARKTPERKEGLVQVISGGKQYHITLEDYKKMCAIKKSFELKQRRVQAAKQTSLLKVQPRKVKVVSPRGEEFSENILEKLDKQVEKLGEKGLVLPKIPKSLTVIPQTVARRASRPSSPILMITAKPKAAKS